MRFRGFLEIAAGGDARPAGEARLQLAQCRATCAQKLHHRCFDADLVSLLVLREDQERVEFAAALHIAFAVRILPKNSDLSNPFDLGLITWG